MKIEATCMCGARLNVVGETIASQVVFVEWSKNHESCSCKIDGSATNLMNQKMCSACMFMARSTDGCTYHCSLNHVDWINGKCMMFATGL